MKTIKGPITLGKNIEADLRLIKKAGIEISLPFKATNWVSDRNMSIIPEKFKKKVAVIRSKRKRVKRRKVKKRSKS